MTFTTEVAKLDLIGKNARTEVEETDRAVAWCRAVGLDGEADQLAAFALGVVPSRYPMRSRNRPGRA